MELKPDEIWAERQRLTAAYALTRAAEDAAYAAKAAAEEAIEIAREDKFRAEDALYDFERLYPAKRGRG